MPEHQGMRTVLSALSVLEEVAYAQPVGVGDLARALRLPKSTVQRCLRTLWTAGWICPTGSEVTRWVLTSRAMHVGQRAVADIGVREAAAPIMRELRDSTGETIHLMVRENDRAVLIERVETEHPVRAVVPLGSSAPVHGSSNGKAMLAPLPEDEVRAIIGEKLVRYTANTIVDWPEFLTELAEVHRRGYAVNLGEWRSDITAVASAVFGAEGDPVASLSVSTPSSRMPSESLARYGAEVAAAARRVSATLGHRQGPDPG